MKQINLRSPVLIQLIKYAVVAVLAIVIFNWFEKCSSGSGEKQKITIPAISGKFEPKKPEAKPLEIIQESINQIKKDGTVYIPNPLNEKLAKENEKLKSDFAALKNDSLKQKVYEKAIELNTFSSKFEDQYMILNINGIVRGEVQEITPSYTRKEFELETKQKQTVFRMLAGAEIGSSIITPKFNIKGNLMLQNKRGDIISGSYDSNQVIWIGFNKSIFNIKR